MMEVKKIVNLFRKAEGYISFNAEHANEIADALEEFERKKENLIDYNAYLNNRLDKAESYIEKLEKQFSEKQEWISVDDKPFPRLEKGDVKYYLYSEALNSYIVYSCENNGIVSHWMRIEPPKQKEQTFKDVFLKAFPKAPLSKDDVPGVCIADVFPWGIPINCEGIRCNRCWNQPYFEPEEEGGEE